jgi:hypothetical protein
MHGKTMKNINDIFINRNPVPKRLLRKIEEKENLSVPYCIYNAIVFYIDKDLC